MKIVKKLCVIYSVEIGGTEIHVHTNVMGKEVCEIADHELERIASEIESEFAPQFSEN